MIYVFVYTKYLPNYAVYHLIIWINDLYLSTDGYSCLNIAAMAAKWQGGDGGGKMKGG